MKAFTDLEQSKKLAEILPIESADMCYPYDRHLNKMYGDIPYVMGYKRFNESTDIPCWSLAALLKVIPNYNLSGEHNHHTCSANVFYGKEQVGWYDNPLDAAFEMIVWLKENNRI